MTEIRFYHLQTKTLEQALPEILSKAFSQGRRAVVKAPDEKAVSYLNDKLWTFHPDSFLPHGTAREGHGADQPIWLTAEDDNPNGAKILILTGGAESEKLSEYELCCEMLDGLDDEMVAGARQRWKRYKEEGFDITYWQQDPGGRWIKKA